MKYVCVLLIRFYQKFLSPLKGNPSCRFSPTCSAYAVDAFMKRGFFVGFGLTAWRILRCNPFFRGGYDPVPEPKHKRIPKYDTDKARRNAASEGVDVENELAAHDNDDTANN